MTFGLCSKNCVCRVELDETRQHLLTTRWQGGAEERCRLVWEHDSIVYYCCNPYVIAPVQWLYIETVSQHESERANWMSSDTYSALDLISDDNSDRVIQSGLIAKDALQSSIVHRDCVLGQT